MERRNFCMLYVFIAGPLLQQVNGNWALEGNSVYALTSKERAERVSSGFCPDDWYTFGEKCYLISTGRRSWSSADRACKEMKSNLVSIESQEEQDFLSLLQLELRNEYWIGLRRLNSVSEIFQWSDASSLDFTNWAEGEPNNYENQEECAHMKFYRSVKTGEWNDASCRASMFYICEKFKDPNLPGPGRDPALCTKPESWRKHGNSCYKLFHKSESYSSWKQAQSLCETHGGNLAYVKNPGVNLLLHISSKGLQGPFWIGIKRTKTNKYTWLGKEHLLAYSNWQIDQPKDVPDEQNCVAIDEEGKWVVRDCDERHPLICEVGPDLPKEPPTIAPLDTNMTCSYTSTKWHDIGGRYCYIIELNSQFKWGEALCRCDEEGGDLASIHSAHEIRVLLQYIQHHDVAPTNLFIGFVRDEAGRFVWSDGSPTDYVNWSYGEPNSLDEQCAEMASSDGKWNDHKCSAKVGYICSILKVPIKGVESESAKPSPESAKPSSENEGLRPESQTAETKDTGTEFGAGSTALTVITCLLVLAAISVVSLYFFGPSLKTKLFTKSSYTGIE